MVALPLYCPRCFAILHDRHLADVEFAQDIYTCRAPNCRGPKIYEFEAMVKVNLGDGYKFLAYGEYLEKLENPESDIARIMKNVEEMTQGLEDS